MKTVCTQGRSADFCSRIQGLLYLDTSTVHEFLRGYLKKGYVHISAQRAPSLGHKCECCLSHILNWSNLP